MVSLKSNRRRERNFVWKAANDLRRRDDGALFGGQFRECLRELRVAVVLSGAGGCQKLLGCGELVKSCEGISSSWVCCCGPL